MGATIQVSRPRVEPILPPAPGQVVDQPAERLSFDDLTYAGAFRVPDPSNGESFSYGGQTLAYNPVSDTLFLGSLGGMVAELSIPSPVRTTVREDLPVASFVQPLRDPTDGHLRDIAEQGVILSGLLVHDRRLSGTGLIYYDAANHQRLSHFNRSLDLTRAEVDRADRPGECHHLHE